jgi:hypothetical protein
MKLPSPIQTYFDADKDVAGPAPSSAFAIDAVQKAIAAWWRAAKAQYQHTADPREISEAGGYITVLAEVSGKFSGSPAMLSFRFTLKDQEIATLEIGV